MKKNILIFTLFIFMLNGCATRTTNIKATNNTLDEKKELFDSFECKELEKTLYFISERKSILGSKQNRKVKDDGFTVTFLPIILLFSPISVFELGDREVAKEYSYALGEYNYVKSLSKTKSCDINLKKYR